MKAVVLSKTGPADNLELLDIDRPQPSAGHVLVRVRAAGVCYRDIIDRRGGFPFMKLPVVPGHEFAGEVEAVSDDVTSVAAGDRVVNLHRAPCGECEYCIAGHEPRCNRALFAFGLSHDGGYAEYVSAPAGCLVPLPESIPFSAGCFLACTAGVALRAMRTHGRLESGQRVLITGASGGVGLHAVQIAKAMGASVTAITSSADKVEALERLGADSVVVSEDLRFHKKVSRVDVALDCVGTPTINASLRSLEPVGRCVVVGNVTTERVEVNPGLVILNELTLVGSAGCNRADLVDVMAWIESGELEPVIADTLPLGSAADAHRRLEQRQVTGRIVLEP